MLSYPTSAFGRKPARAPRSAFAVHLPAWGRRWAHRLPLPEFAIVAVLAAITGLIAAHHGLSLALPGASALTMFGVHYLIPVVTMGIWGAVIFLTRRSNDLFYYAAAFACYLALLILHFNLKLWIPLVNPASWDAAYMAADERLRPVVEFCFAAHRALAALFGDIDGWYLFGFVLMFYFSFILHAVQSPLVFRRLVVASFLVHALGALAYLAAPAVGPFIYEEGVNALASESQAGMYAAHQVIREQGAAWLALNAEANLTAGLAAMPSLHTGAAAVFLYFAWRYLPGLVILYLPAFCFILVEAVATRWHYIVDLPVGAALAAFSIWAAHRLYPERDQRRRAAALGWKA